MNNMQYHDQIKGMLEKGGYQAADIDSRTLAVIRYADANKLNAIELIENGLDSDQISREMVTVINSMRPNTSFITKRTTQVPTNKYIRRSIIE